MAFVKGPGAVYVHIPFCRSKCFYCDFNSYAGLEGYMAEYVRALHTEIDCCNGGSEIASVYFGGGTPTLLAPDILAELLDTLAGKFVISRDCEITCEANPGTVTLGSMSLLVKAGFNRLSLGIQSLDRRVLRCLGRIHSPEEARLSVAAARKAGFDNINLDIMYRLPLQTLEMLEQDVFGILDMRPVHISAYELTVADNTPFGHKKQELESETPSDGKDASDLLWGILSANGYERYEVSNCSIRGFRSRHNLNYWRRGEYYGFGAGASSFLDGTRTTNIQSVPGYISAVGSDGRAAEYSERLTPEEELTELLMLGLRTSEGVAVCDLRSYDGAEAVIARASLIPELLIYDGVTLKCTGRGIDLLNYVLETIL